MLQQVHGDRYPDPELFTKSLVLRPKVRLPGWIYYPYLIVKGLLRFAWWLVFYGLYRFGYLGVPAVLTTGLFIVCGWRIGVAVVVLVAAGLLVWWWRASRSFWRWLGWFYLAQWRRWWVYYRHWFATCANLGLAMSFGGQQYFPSILKVCRDGDGDMVTVRMVNGQLPTDWAKRAANLAHTFNASSCLVHPSGGKRHRNRIVLHFRVVDSLAAMVAPLAVPAVPDMAALPVAVRGGERKVTISVLTHVLIAGASGSGKGGVLWAIVSALAAGIRSGTVRVYAFDPKGGVEFEPGQALFYRFHFGEPEEMAGALEDLVKEMKRRQVRQRGQSRTHSATVDEPTIVVLIDEFGALTSYLTDKKLKERINSAMSLILSQGRAIGVHVVAALQDPRKEILPFRNLFITRIALRLTEKSEVALILDDDAVDRGAACHWIPKSLPGKAYMVLETDPTPVEVRFPYHTDADIEELASTYAPTDFRQAFEVNR
ncbi:MAG TPA: FtsK/SpoIIIE domain-containing protein [Candidatus Limnocylindrales bacterium]|nr:FtsK/SpoIIIE domain-containing protein [Candidatus Limnocylindrales bacterium]